MARRPQAPGFVFVVAAVLFAVAAVAQVSGPVAPGASPPKPSGDAAIQVGVEMVLVNATVTDPHDHPVTNLAKEHFRIFENDVEQEILTFSHEDAPVSIGLLFDMSNSMKNKVDKVRNAALQVLQTANPQDEFFLVTFGSRAKLTSDFTPDLSELRERMMSEKPKGQTALLDAIVIGMEQMKHARNRNRAFVVISDGGDNHSRAHESQIQRDLREADTQLYAMGIFDPEDMKRTREEREGPTLLSEFAELTGGQVFSVGNLDDLPEVASKIGRNLRDRYVLGYKPSGLRDGAWRSIKVELAAPGALPPLRVYARTGYYAPED